MSTPNADPELTVTITGVVDGESTDLISVTSISRAEGEDSGEYTITPTGEAEQGNYAVTFETGTLTIVGKPVTVKNDQNEDVPAATGDAAITEDQNGITLTLITPEPNTPSQPVEIPHPVEVDHIVIERDYVTDRAATIYLPFSIEVSKMKGGTFHIFTDVDETTTPWTVNYSDALASTDMLVANTPYIFLPDGTNGGKITVNNGTDKVTVCTANPHTTMQGQWEFIGTILPIVWDADHEDLGKVYGFAAEDKTVGGTNYEIGQFVRVGAGASIAPMRAYLKYTSTTNAPAHHASGANATTELPKTMRVVIGSNVTSIDTLNMEVGDNDAWYTINGQKLNGKPTVKGIYIHNGVKVGIK